MTGRSGNWGDRSAEFRHANGPPLDDPDFGMAQRARLGCTCPRKPCGLSQLSAFAQAVSDPLLLIQTGVNSTVNGCAFVLLIGCGLLLVLFLPGAIRYPAIECLRTGMTQWCHTLTFISRPPKFTSKYATGRYYRAGVIFPMSHSMGPTKLSDCHPEALGWKGANREEQEEEEDKNKKKSGDGDMKQGTGKEGVWLYFPTFGGTITST
jgi:hypothetical protein